MGRHLRSPTRAGPEADVPTVPVSLASPITSSAGAPLETPPQGSQFFAKGHSSEGSMASAITRSAGRPEATSCASSSWTSLSATYQPTKHHYASALPRPAQNGGRLCPAVPEHKGIANQATDVPFDPATLTFASISFIINAHPSQLQNPLLRSNQEAMRVVISQNHQFQSQRGPLHGPEKHRGKAELIPQCITPRLPQPAT
jgi:hypothetical protein